MAYLAGDYFLSLYHFDSHRQAPKSHAAKVILSDDEILASSPVDRLKAAKPPRLGYGHIFFIKL